MNVKKMILGTLVVLIVGLVIYLLRPLSNIPAPATFTCTDIADGSFLAMDSLPEPQFIYGMGLTYSQHLKETAAEFNPGEIPPIFYKKKQSLSKDGDQVNLPTAEQMIQASQEFEPAVGDKLRADFPDLSPMLDYEVELGFVLLEDVNSTALQDDDFVPSLGFFISNDLSARSIALLGEGTSMRYEYWGISKSFPGFLPVGGQVWIPNAPRSNTIPCVKIETYVNGKVRQSQTTDNMIYTPLEMLRFIAQKYPMNQLKRGDMVLTGTPGGVAIATPRALVRLSNLLGFDRYKKLSIKQGGDLSGFLKAGDIVEVSGEGLGKIRTKIVLD
ncbi:MAG: fumarylacetoacetate hydrolase family protein [Saprospiraceae bacterium]|nr:fumarylacetoacetate hydrolase family protein [Saprospiraceae bacterium]